MKSSETKNRLAIIYFLDYIIDCVSYIAMVGNQTQVDCLEGNHNNHYTTIAKCLLMLA